MPYKDPTAAKRYHQKYYRKYYLEHKNEYAERSRNFSINNREARRSISRAYYRRHTKRSLRRSKNYKKTHPGYNRRYSFSRRSTDLNFKILCTLRSQFTWALHKKKRLDRTSNLLGCSVAFFKKYIAEQFKPGMSWRNHGKWHLDHIKPCASFDFTRLSEQRACFHYTNYQPLWAADNLHKHAKWEAHEKDSQ